MRPLRGSARLACVLLVGAHVILAGEGRAADVRGYSAAATAAGVRTLGDERPRTHASRDAETALPQLSNQEAPAGGVDVRDRWLEQVWWAAFAATTAAYVLVLGVLGIRRLRAGQPRLSTWEPLDVPVVAPSTGRVRPHL